MVLKVIGTISLLPIHYNLFKVLIQLNVLYVVLYRNILNNINSKNLKNTVMKRALMFFLVIFGITYSYTINAQTLYEVISHSLKVEGTSNLHDWNAEVEKAKGTFLLKIENGKITDLEDLKLVIDATSFKSSKGSIMNSKINDALNAKKYPEIRYELKKVNSIKENQGTYKVSTTGVLLISGVAQTVTVDAVGRMNANGGIEFSGTKNIKMSDHKVSPPTAMFGALTTGDEVTLTYKVIIKPNLLSDIK